MLQARLHTSLRQIRHFMFSKYRINLGNLNTLEIHSDVPLHPAMISFCNELAQVNTYTSKPMLLLKKVETATVQVLHAMPEEKLKITHSFGLISESAPRAD